MCGWEWKRVVIVGRLRRAFLFSYNIQLPVISISLASKPSTQNRPILLAIITLPPTVALLVPYFLLFCLEERIN